jgi:peptide/nickel transport system ATP-binding protein
MSAPMSEQGDDWEPALAREPAGPSPTQVTAEPLLVVDNLSVSFPTDDGLVQAVRGVSFELGERDVLGIVGESGSGKSVSTMALLGLLPKTARISGSARFHGQEMVGLPDREARAIRGKRIAMIFQDPMTSLNPVYTVGYQLAEAVRAHHEVSMADAKRRAVEMLDLVGIPQAAARINSYPHEFSGGMRQRAMIAMSIINDPELIIADEPTTALDVTVQAQVLEVLQTIRDEFKTAIILITHDLGVVAGMADRVMVMYAGRLVEQGAVDDVYEQPRMPYTVGLLGSVPTIDHEGELTPIKGAPPSLINLPPGCPFSPRCPLVQADCQVTEPDLYPTDRKGHVAACLHWDELVTVDDATELFGEVAT